jgi:SulP family sulfate permease
LGGNWNAFLLCVVLAGMIQLLLGYLKSGFIAYFFPNSVIKGMLSGIGLLIILKQIPHALGWDIDVEGDDAFLQSDGQNTISEIGRALSYITPGAIIISIASLIMLILWDVYLTKKHKIFQLIQGPIVVVVFGILMFTLYQSDYLPFQLKSNQIVSLPVPKSIPDFFGQFTFPDFSYAGSWEVWKISIVIAIVASLETLLCVEATDKIDPQKYITPTNRELKAQGLGNLISGLIGGLPITQVIVRSSANISFNAKTKLSAILHGFFLLICVISIPNILNMIPLASLACVLLVVGYKLINPKLIYKTFKLGNEQFIPFLITIICMIIFDLLKGVMLGMLISLGFIIFHNFRNAYEKISETENKQHDHVIKLAQEVSFLNKGAIIEMLKNLPNDSSVIIDASDSKVIDYDIYEILKDFKINAKSRNINLQLKGISSSKI